MYTPINVHVVETTKKKEKQNDRKEERQNDNYCICIHATLQGNLTNVRSDIKLNQ
jgi:hypothetical protein